MGWHTLSWLAAKCRNEKGKNYDTGANRSSAGMVKDTSGHTDTATDKRAVSAVCTAARVGTWSGRTYQWGAGDVGGIGREGRNGRDIS